MKLHRPVPHGNRFLSYVAVCRSWWVDRFPTYAWGIDTLMDLD